MNVTESITRTVPSTLGGVSPEDLAAEQPVVDRLKALLSDVSKVEYSYDPNGTTLITVSGKPLAPEAVK